jgi:ferredoxin-NADP reductase
VEESRALLQELKDAHSYVQYSRPGPADQMGIDFDAAGHLAVSAFDKIGVPHEAQFYLCGPPAFLRELTAGLEGWGLPADHVHTEIFGTLDSTTPGMKTVPHSPHLLPGPAGLGPQVPSPGAGSRCLGMQNTGACSNLPKHAMCL